MALRGLVIGVFLTACAGSHGGDGEAGSSGAAGSQAGAAGAAGSQAGASGAAGSHAGASGAAGSHAGACGHAPMKHRPLAEMCDHERGPSSPQPGAVAGCMSDAECTEGENGRCGGNNRGLRTCNYDQCFADVDCMSQGGPCICGVGSEANNRCFMGNCRTDGDCGSNGYCSPSFGTCGSYLGVVAYYCHTCKDECIDDGDCTIPNGYCAYEPTAGRWKCSSSQCVG